ncbi:MAG: lipopolysaccharide assembly protein LapA domain-containing protein [Stellaceae bacterium]
MRYVYWAVTALIALVLVLFAVSNRTGVSLTLFPVPAKLEAPLYLVVLVTLVVGFLLGEAAAWIGGARRRAEARDLRRRHDRLQREMVATKPAAEPKRLERP